MEATEARRAVAAAMSTASELDLAVDDAIVLSDSNRLVIRLTPCDTVARVTPMTHFASAEQEVELVRRLAQTDSPVAPLEPRVEPRVFVHNGFKIALWAYFEPARSRMLPPAEYAQALARLHAGLRRIEVTTPHFMDRVAATQCDVASTRRTGRSSLTSKTPPVGRSSTTWPGCPARVSQHYPDADQDLVGECRGVVLAIVAAHRWSLNDQHPSGRESGVAFLRVLREGPPWPALDDVVW
jgi:hypothetical protein